MTNNKELAMKYGTDKSFFVKNKAEIDWRNVRYSIVNAVTQRHAAADAISFKSGDLVQISNPYWLKIRTDKIVCDLLQITRSKVKQLENAGRIEIVRNPCSPNIEILLRVDIDISSIY
jgi:hypothetical protein